ncbi:MAG TPA: hypothetical protein PLE04_09275, partial [Syntrophales bacterium]|nr:hypothetical protein [Syntrophales bacterium]
GFNTLLIHDYDFTALLYNDGFVKSPYAVLPFFPRPCGVPSVRLSPRDSGALPMELFTLPFEKVLNWPFYEFFIQWIRRKHKRGSPPGRLSRD